MSSTTTSTTSCGSRGLGASSWPLWALLGLGVIIRIIDELIPGGVRRSLRTYQYSRKEFFMTRAEHEFFDILLSIAGDRYHVFPQVHLPTVVDNKVKGQNWKAAFKHISQKSVDFVICDKAYIKPLLAIELDDSSHERYNRQLRDEEVERICKEAGLPLLRFPAQAQYHKAEISQRIFDSLGAT